MLVPLQLINGDHLAINPEILVYAVEDMRESTKCTRIDMGKSGSFFVKQTTNDIINLVHSWEKARALASGTGITASASR